MVTKTLSNTNKNVIKMGVIIKDLLYFLTSMILRLLIFQQHTIDKYVLYMT
jgi:hypothetical protein